MLNSKNSVSSCCHFFFFGRHSLVKLFLTKARPCIFLVDFLKKKKKQQQQRKKLSKITHKVEGKRGKNEKKKSFFPFRFFFFFVCVCVFRCSWLSNAQIPTECHFKHPARNATLFDQKEKMRVMRKGKGLRTAAWPCWLRKTKQKQASNFNDPEATRCFFFFPPLLSFSTSAYTKRYKVLNIECMSRRANNQERTFRFQLLMIFAGLLYTKAEEKKKKDAETTEAMAGIIITTTNQPNNNVHFTLFLSQLQALKKKKKERKRN